MYYILFQLCFSFKERGSLNALQLLPLDKKKLGVVVASIGNDGAGLCCHASKMGIPVIVVMPSSTPISKLQKCLSLGAKVVVQGGNLMEAQRYARAIARDKGLTYINGFDYAFMFFVLQTPLSGRALCLNLRLVLSELQLLATTRCAKQPFGPGW